VQWNRGGKSETATAFHRTDAAYAEKIKDEREPSLRSEDVIKLLKSDFFVPKLLVFSITFGRKTKKSQPLRMTARVLQL
jgi:hypothetical protein